MSGSASSVNNEVIFVQNREKVMKKKLITGVLMTCGIAIGFLLGNKIAIRKNDSAGKAMKFKAYYNMLNQWIKLKNNGKNLEEYFQKNKYVNIAIYGMGEIGFRLLEELKESSVTVLFAIDKDGGTPFDEVSVYDLHSEDIPKEVDAIVVTAVFAFSEISMTLSDMFHCPIVSLDEIITQI